MGLVITHLQRQLIQREARGAVNLTLERRHLRLHVRGGRSAIGAELRASRVRARARIGREHGAASICGQFAEPCSVLVYLRLSRDSPSGFWIANSSAAAGGGVGAGESELH